MGVTLLTFLKLFSFVQLVSYCYGCEIQTKWTTAFSLHFHGSVTSFSQYVMWLDAHLIGLPLIILGVDALLQKESVICTSFSSHYFGNYYTGYDLPFLSSLFPICYLLNDSFSWKNFYKTVWPLYLL